MILSILTLYSSIYFIDDLSAAERGSSVYISMMLWLEKPILGFGYNMFEDLSKEFVKKSHLSLYPSKYILSLLPNLVFQMGTLGIIYITIVFKSILNLTGINFYNRIGILIIFTVITSIGGELTYFPFFWLMLATYHIINYSDNYLDDSSKY
ncbi:hypothetical protein [Flammeovirga sp. SubArs3]|uniref:hypothetical protein n=1 Tax=Flammeovirga sp. SubArs3 TaxID=2995316 RepID=UPI00248B4403|nr:hypothetical protein [Flammeovirga sp. SubArs3]